MKISILYFSGTGNTEIIAHLIMNEFKKHESIEIFKIEDILLKKIQYDIEKFDIIGIGYPIYGFNVPFNILKLVKEFPNTTSKRIFLFSTCAGPLYLNDVASYRLKNKLKRKGYSIIFEKQFYMPSNIAFPYKDEVIKQLYEAAVRKTKVMVSDIRSGIIKVRNRIFPLFFRWMYIIEKIAWWTVPIDFKVLKSCNLCKICINKCPQNNIKVKNGKIKFGVNCLACYRCVYNCPKKAITGRLYKFAIIKDGYNIKPILANNEIEENYINRETKGYYKIFYKYLYETKDKSST